MLHLKISIVTVTYNAGSTIERRIQSVIGQIYKNVEYIVIDGASTDNTIQVIDRYKNHIHHFISEPDRGIYDAMDKGIAFATGEIVGMLNADDVFSDSVLRGRPLRGLLGMKMCADSLWRPRLRGELRKFSANGGQGGTHMESIIGAGCPRTRRFIAGANYLANMDFIAWTMGPPLVHQLMARFMHKHRLSAFYLEKVIVNMEIGGASNKNWGSRVKGLNNDLRAMRDNGIQTPTFCHLRFS